MNATTTPRAGALVLFGITGDLAKKMLLPALYQLVRRGELSEPIVGVAREDWTLDQLRRHAREAIMEVEGPVDEEAFARLAGLMRMVTVADDPADYDRLAAETEGLGFLAHYLAVPPGAFASVAGLLAGAGLAGDARLVVEKPFGSDLASAQALQAELIRSFPEDRLRRVDHFLGKDVVQNLLTFRFANPMVDAVLRREHVRSVQITMAEDFDVADRGSFYDATGAVRDVVQNHLLQVLSYFLMEAPQTDAAVDMLDEKARVLSAVRTVRPEHYVAGQYAGYREVEGVKADSVVETYAALRLFCDNDRWSGVPFTIRSGKSMATTSTEIVVELSKPSGDSPVQQVSRDHPSLLRFRLMPHAGVTFDLVARRGSDPAELDEVAPTAEFAHLTGSDPVAYEHVLAEAVTGDPRHFARMDVVEECWRIVGDILVPTDPPVVYQPGSWGPAEADHLVTDGRWFPLESA
jgi:glucose-6-phosphate 1-dehydrogenase